MDSPQVSTNSALAPRVGAGDTSNEVSAATARWLKKAQEPAVEAAPPSKPPIQGQLKAEIMSHLRGLQEELDATAWMYSSSPHEK
jgi:hypothetical protein